MQMRPPLDIRAMLLDLHRMRLELERELDQEQSLLTRDGSVRGRKLHVFNTIRRMRNKEQWKKDYIAAEQQKVVVYITSCGIHRRVWERCRDSVHLLRAHNIQVEVRDLNLDSTYVDELLDRMQLEKSDRELIFDSLPTVYVNGKYFGNDATLIQENEKRQLGELLRDFKGRHDCSYCQGSGYSVCQKCRGGKKAAGQTFSVRLKCATCDENGIAPCAHCAPRAKLTR